MQDAIQLVCARGQILLISPEDQDLLEYRWRYRTRGSPEVMDLKKPKEGSSLLTIVTRRIGLRQRTLKKCGDDFRRESLRRVNQDNTADSGILIRASPPRTTGVIITMPPNVAQTIKDVDTFAERYGVDPAEVVCLSADVRVYSLFRTRALNGDYHPGVEPPDDKNANARNWEHWAEIIATKITERAKALGFDRVDFGVGLIPVLEKGNETAIMVPCINPVEDDD